MAGPSRDPEEPAAHVSDYLALLPSGPDAVRRLRLHRVRAALRPVTIRRAAPPTTMRWPEIPQSIAGSETDQARTVAGTTARTSWESCMINCGPDRSSVSRPGPNLRRDVRAVEGARLESVCRGNSTVGSNPTLSATLFSSYIQQRLDTPIIAPIYKHFYGVTVSAHPVESIDS